MPDFDDDTISNYPDAVYMKSASGSSNNTLELECQKIYPTITISGTAGNIRIVNKLTGKKNVMTAEYAARGFDYVALYDEDHNETNRIINIKGREWQHISLDGEWTPEDEIPTDADRMQANIDYLTMVNESMEETIEQQQADIDYLLMLSEDEEE